jgi:hypothetical protein
MDNKRKELIKAKYSKPSLKRGTYGELIIRLLKKEGKVRYKRISEQIRNAQRVSIIQRRHAWEFLVSDCKCIIRTIEGTHEQIEMAMANPDKVSYWTRQYPKEHLLAYIELGKETIVHWEAKIKEAEKVLALPNNKLPICKEHSRAIEPSLSFLVTRMVAHDMIDKVSRGIYKLKERK